MPWATPRSPTSTTTTVWSSSNRRSSPTGARSPGARRTTASVLAFSYDTESVNPVQVLEEALDVFHDAAVEAGLPAWQVVRCEILTYAEDDARDGAEDEA